VDGLGNVIAYPTKANHTYLFGDKWLNYTQQCDYMCASNPSAESDWQHSGGWR
jgi:hypothetical protein